MKIVFILCFWHLMSFLIVGFTFVLGKLHLNSGGILLISVFLLLALGLKMGFGHLLISTIKN